MLSFWSLICKGSGILRYNSSSYLRTSSSVRVGAVYSHFFYNSPNHYSPVFWVSHSTRLTSESLVGIFSHGTEKLLIQEALVAFGCVEGSWPDAWAEWSEWPCSDMSTVGGQMVSGSFGWFEEPDSIWSSEYTHINTTEQLKNTVSYCKLYRVYPPQWFQKLFRDSSRFFYRQRQNSDPEKHRSQNLTEAKCRNRLCLWRRVRLLYWPKHKSCMCLCSQFMKRNQQWSGEETFFLNYVLAVARDQLLISKY